MSQFGTDTAKLSAAEVRERLKATRDSLRRYKSSNVVQWKDPNTGETRTLYAAQPLQDQLHSHRAPNLLFGGSAGGSKSHGLRWHGILTALRIPEARILLLRRTFPELESTHLDRFRLELPREIAVVVDKRVRFNHTGSVIVCGHLQHETDIGQYLSTEWDLILVDEASEFPPKALSLLASRARSKKQGVRPQVVMASNPGGEAHAYLLDLFIEQTGGQWVTDYNPAEYGFIPANVWDNAYIDDAYITRLAGLPEPERSAYLEGKWTVFAGQFFREYDPAIHCAKLPPIPDWWEVEGGFDWGFDPDPWVLLLAAFDQHGRPHFAIERTGTLQTPREVAETMHAALPKEWRGSDGILVRCDPSTNKRTPHSQGVTIMAEINDRLAELGSPLTLVSGNNDRINGWMRVRTYLDPRRPRPEGGVGPFCVIAKPDERTGYGCPTLMRTIAAARHHPNRPGDMAAGDDHPLDAMRYLLMAREPLSIAPEIRGNPFNKASGMRDTLKKLSRTTIDADTDASGGVLVDTDLGLVDDERLLSTLFSE